VLYQRGDEGTSMAKSEYARKLLDPRWQRKRLEALNEAKWECMHCSEKTRTLHVHHKRYIKGREPWEYGIDELSVLCDECHEAEHHARDTLNRLLGEASECTALQVVGLVAGFLAADYNADPALAEEARQISVREFELGTAAFVLMCEGPDVWQELIRRHVASRSAPGPVLMGLIERWDEAERERAERGASA
jgi:hypothetical protein